MLFLRIARNNNLNDLFAVKSVTYKVLNANFSQESRLDHSQFYRAKNPPQDVWQEKKDPKYTGVEEVKDRWHYVERLFPQLRIPSPPNSVSPVGWKAPSPQVPDLPYFVDRSRNHMLPVYQLRINKDKLLVTAVNKIFGDIWVFEYDLKNYLEQKMGEKIESHVNEIVSRVNFRGDHVSDIKEWLYNKGF